MAYKQKRYVFKNAIEIEEFHTARYGAPGMKRLKKKKKTPEQIAWINQRNKESRCRRRLRAHFEVNDYFITMTCAKDMRFRDMQEATKAFGKFCRRLKREYRKRGYELKFIRNIEVGKRNAWHVHMAINRIPDTDLIVRKLWTFGKVIMQLIYERGEFKDLAAYLTKSPLTDSRLVDASYSASRNIPIPEPKEKIYMRWKTWKEIPKMPKGFYLDPESYHEGENPVTGYPYRVYTLLKIKRE